ncbi:MAG: NmrA family NAD(P)-binding protein [Cytophagales bacterium]|nr:NmrA family NAD(P)-binding protein [Cytophagales bacterium]
MKKYVITGSIGHTGKIIVAALAKAGHDVVVVTSKESNKAAIEQLGAKAAVGSIKDATFVKNAFAGAEIAYTMIPADFTAQDFRKYQNMIGDNYIQAITGAGIKYVVNLSSVGAHMGNGAGVVDGLSDFEKMLDALATVNAVHLRPSFFYYNFLAQIPMIKGMGIMGANYGSMDTPILLTHTDDIADVALEYLLNPTFNGHTVRYIASDDRTLGDVCKLIGNAIGKPLNWVQFPDDQAKAGMLQMGLPETIANGYIELGIAFREGKMEAHYRQNPPAALGNIKLEQYIPEFVAAYQHGGGAH